MEAHDFLLLDGRRPIAQFLIFYVYVNFNSIVLAFKDYYLTTFTGYGLGNFRQLFSTDFHQGINVDSITQASIYSLTAYLLAVFLIFQRRLLKNLNVGGIKG